MELKRVVITGLGALTPIGNNVKEFWDNLIAGTSGADYITHFDTSKFKTKFACEVKNFDLTQYFDRKEMRKLDPYAQYAIIASDQAIQDSGLNLDAIDKDNVGVIWASGIGGMETFMEEMKTYMRGDGTPRFNPFFVPKMITDIAAGHISIKYGFRGPNFATVSACASSANAIISGLHLIRMGISDIIVTGGSEAPIIEAGVGGFNSMQALSTNNENYKTASRPFDVSRDGFVMGEGAGALILEEYEHAKRRGARIYGELLGGGLSADAYHLTAPHPEGLGARLVMQRAIKDAGIKTEDIDYINVHGTSTPLGDISEILAIKEVFRENAYNLNISSTKSMTGHLLGAAGAIEAITALLSTIYDTVPATINLVNLDPAIDPALNLTANKAQKREVTYALSNTFGFGGHNTSVIFKKLRE
jgi:3-oxoacyl-[acyl-carrier-protein] synthase II